ncbi:MAG: helicase HerA domain-containing protein, partial [Thermoplasmata archaeon]
MNALLNRTLPSRAYRFLPDGPSWDLPFLRRLAEGLSSYPAGQAVLLECTESAEPLVILGSTELESVVQRAAWGLPGHLESVEPIPSGSPVPPGRTRFGVVCPRDAPDRRDPEAFRRSDPGDRDAARGIASWIPNEPEAAPPSEGCDAMVQWHWFSTGRDRLAVRVRLRVSGEARGLPGRLVGSAARIVSRLREGSGAVDVSSLRPTRRRRRAWASGSLAGFWKGVPFDLAPACAARAVRPLRPMASFDDVVLARHVAILGASGSGKSSFLSHLAVERIRRGRPTVVLDVHGDLG